MNQKVIHYQATYKKQELDGGLWLIFISSNDDLGLNAGDNGNG